MLDSSPNAQKAFELTKLQELTRQQEIQREIHQVIFCCIGYHTIFLLDESETN